MNRKKVYLAIAYMAIFAFTVVWQQLCFTRLAYKTNDLKSALETCNETINLQRVVIAELDSPSILKKHCAALRINLRPTINWAIAKDARTNNDQRIAMMVFDKDAESGE